MSFEGVTVGLSRHPDGVAAGLSRHDSGRPKAASTSVPRTAGAPAEPNGAPANIPQ